MQVKCLLVHREERITLVSPPLHYLTCLPACLPAYMPVCLPAYMPACFVSILSHHFPLPLSFAGVVSLDAVSTVVGQ